jgi:hypothetical protein
MIRRRVGNDWFLIAQNDHAVLAAHFARHWSNDRFARPDPLDETLRGVAMHDAGWPLHDDTPTLNTKREPIDVFESTREIALKVWRASGDRAQVADLYSGLLVSMHSLALSLYATSPSPMKHEKFDTSRPTEQFEINKFQHYEIERQENLRRQLHMRTDIPLEFGLAKPGIDPNEDQLRFNFRLLQAMDQLSLAACCTQPPSDTTTEVHESAARKPLKLKLHRINGVDVTVDPWPFDQPQIDASVPFCRVPARPFSDVEEFRAKYTAAPLETLSFAVHPV